MHTISQTATITADKTALQLIGFTLAALAVATILVAGVVVHRTLTIDLTRDVPISRLS
jgi:hypothetical protein